MGEDDLIETEINFDLPTNKITIHKKDCHTYNPEDTPKQYQDGFNATALLSKKQILFYDSHKFLKGMLAVCKICRKSLI